MTHAEQRAKLIEMMASAMTSASWNQSLANAQAILAALHGHYTINATEPTLDMVGAARDNCADCFGDIYRTMAAAGDLTRPTLTKPEGK